MYIQSKAVFLTPTPSLRDVAHDGWLCNEYIYYITAAFQLAAVGSSCQGYRYGTEKASSTARSSRTKKHLPGHSPPASRAGRRVEPAL